MRQKISFLTFLLAIAFQQAIGQLYFPPVQGNTWETISPSNLGWNEAKIEELKTYLASVDSKAFIILKDGKIVVEHYMNGHSADKNWYWASAGKSLTSTLIGIASGEGKIDINSPSSTYLGKGWSSMTTEQEENVTVKHHLSMTTGLDDSNFECTDPSCIKYKAEPSTRWSYHNAPYTLCDGIIEGATGKNLTAYFKEKIGEKIGMTGSFFKSGYNNIFYSNARSMARFGLLALAKGKWGNSDIINNQSYVDAMYQSSQSINPSYGYLWWLNGKEKFMLPSSQIKFNGSLIPNAPSDMYCALGKNDQKIHVVPSLGLVIIRMGENSSADNNPVPIKFDIKLWDYLNPIMGIASSNDLAENASPIMFDQNSLEITIDEDVDARLLTIFHQDGTRLGYWLKPQNIQLGHLTAGVYLIRMLTNDGQLYTRKIIII